MPPAMTSFAKVFLPLLFLLSAAAEALPAQAEPDLMNTAECKLARERFDAAFAQARDRNPPAPQLDDARRNAALACFGKAATAPAATSGTRSPQPTVVVPQAGAARRMLPTAPPATAGEQAPVEIGRPHYITTCDPNGCWGSDGSRLNRIGPELAGPRGVCNVQGSVVACP